MDETIDNGRLFGISKDKASKIAIKIVSTMLISDKVSDAAKLLGFKDSKNEELFGAFLFGKFVEKNNGLVLSERRNEDGDPEGEKRRGTHGESS